VVTALGKASSSILRTRSGTISALSRGMHATLRSDVSAATIGPHRGALAGLAALGVLSALSGASLCVRPRALARVYGLPVGARLARAIGVRDLVVGLGLLLSRTARASLLLRALSDGADALLIVAEARRKPQGRAMTSLRLLIAAGSAGYALKLRAVHRGHPPP
jgi:hypothetical protein